eukprot:759407-Hanusia_phi.AAC.1
MKAPSPSVSSSAHMRRASIAASAHVRARFHSNPLCLEICGPPQMISSCGTRRTRTGSLAVVTAAAL